MTTIAEHMAARRARVVGPDVPRWHHYAPPQDRAHFVYRIYDRNDSLLYIGCTRTLRERIRQHYDGAPWNTQMAYWTAWRYSDRLSALDAEAAAIASEAPAFNVVHNIGEVVPA